MKQKPTKKCENGVQLRPASIEEAGLFYSELDEKQDEALGTVGHIRMDFGSGGKEFWHTWWPHNEDRFNTLEFKEELQAIVDTLRANGPLKDLAFMSNYCHKNGGAITEDSRSFGYVAETDHYRYCLRCTPTPGDYQGYLLGRFVMEHIHTPTHAARGYLDPEIVGVAYREHGSGSFVENHYVERLNPDRPLPEVNPNVPLPITGEYAIRVKLVSRNNMEGVWIGFPDTGEYMDTAHPDELLLGLDALQAETLDQCMAVDVDCVLPQITDILNQYDSAGELVRHAIDFGYVWAEQGQGEPHWMEKWQCVMELEDCHRLDLALDLAQNLHCYEFIPRGVDLAQYGMDLARKEGVLGQDPLLIQCFDSVAYAQHHMAKYGLSATDHGYAARNEQEIIYEYSQPEHEPEMTM